MSSADEDDTTIHSIQEPHLNPTSVLSLASNIPNCCVVTPPAVPSHPPALPNAASAPSFTESVTSSLSLIRSNSSKESSSVLDNFRRRLTLSTSVEEGEDVQNANDETILSFLVSDPNYAMESVVAAAAAAEGRGGGMSELAGAGIARIDVYCMSGTVCTCRVVQTGEITLENTNNNRATSTNSSASTAPMRNNNDILGISTQSSSRMSPTAVLSSIVNTPRVGNVTGNSIAEWTASGSRSLSPSLSNTSSRSNLSASGRSMSQTNSSLPSNNDINLTNIQVRRIVQRKCNLKTLRRILENPPKLTEINECIIDPLSLEKDDSASAASSTVSQKLRKRQQRREKKRSKRSAAKKKSTFTKEQQSFLQKEKKKYERRQRNDEKCREHVAKVIASGELFVGVDDLCNVQSLSLEETTVRSTGGNLSIDSLESNESMRVPNDVGIKHSGSKTISKKLNDPYRKQKEIQQKIELADMGLAILMGEKERIEKLMEALRKEEQEDEDGNSLSSKESLGKPNKTAGGERGREGKRHDSRSTRSGSFSTLEKSSRSDNESDSSSSHDSEAEDIARTLQGCEVEYSFPHEHHEELEDALLTQQYSSDEDESEYSSGDDSGTNGDESTKASRASRVSRRRGRSPPAEGFAYRKGDVTRQKRRLQRRDDIPSIVSVPTNGLGCIVLRSNGGFNIIGTIPKPLHKNLFRPKGPLPEYLALGTKGRYFVRFEDGTFFFNGPSSLNTLLNQGNLDTPKSNNFSMFNDKGKNNNKQGKKNKLYQRALSKQAVASIAFGKRFDDYFLVRQNGSWVANGDLPAGLETLLNDRRDRGDLCWVSLGPKNEWCLKAKNGRVWWGGVSDELDEALADILLEKDDSAGEGVASWEAKSRELKYIDFGLDDSYFLLHQ
eukprot:scaffold4986_cov180-Alexandrium_tamarense.AAC.6